MTPYLIIRIFAGGGIVSVMVFEYLRFRKSVQHPLDLEYPGSRLLLRMSGLVMLFALVEILLYLKYAVSNTISPYSLFLLISVVIGLLIGVVVIVLLDMYMTGKALVKKQHELLKGTEHLLKSTMEEGKK